MLQQLLRTASLLTAFILVALIAPFSASHAMAAAPAVPAAPAQRTVRVAAIGGINDLEFWTQFVARFEQATHIRIETAATGNKDGAAEFFKQGKVDVITMGTIDTIVELAAEGWVKDARPWLYSDLALVGPEADPAGVKGIADLTVALKKIVASKSPLVVHSNQGADDVIRSVTQANGIELAAASTSYLLDDHQRRVTTVASERKAYTLIGRVPFKSGKLQPAGLVVMSNDDPRLRRPYLVAMADPARVPGAHVNEAKALVDFMLSAETQAWIGEFGKGKLDAKPLFAPLARPAAAAAQAIKPVAGELLGVSGDVEQPLSLTAADLAKMPRQEVTAKGRDGGESKYSGVALRTILKAAKIPLGDHQLRGEQLTRYLVAESADGYRVVLALAEIDDDFAERNIIVADQRNGLPLDDAEGPLRLILSSEARQARSGKQLVGIVLKRAS